MWCNHPLFPSNTSTPHPTDICIFRKRRRGGTGDSLLVCESRNHTLITCNANAQCVEGQNCPICRICDDENQCKKRKNLPCTVNGQNGRCRGGKCYAVCFSSMNAAMFHHTISTVQPSRRNVSTKDSGQNLAMMKATKRNLTKRKSWET